MDRRLTRTNCSFCGKPRDQARRIVAGPGVFICADCVQLCSQILAADTRPPADLPASLGDQVEARIVKRRLTAGDRWRGLVRRLRLRRFAWSGQ